MRSRLFVVCLLLAVASVGGAQVSKGKLAPRDLPFTPPKKWALVIGASDYTELGKLNYAAKDAQAFADVLKERFDFKPEAIELITDDKDSASKPTVERISAALDRQLKDSRLDKGDLFIFYFSGHGIGTSKGDYLMPTDATAADVEQSGQNVKEIVQKFVKAGLRNVLVIVDACRGGEKNTFGEEFRKLGREANIAVMLSCEPGARSYEYPRLGHGVFTSHLIRSLRSPDLPSSTTGTLWASTILKDIQQKVPEYTIRDYPSKPQTPTGWADTTMDVAIGLFPAKATVRLKLADILAEGERLDQGEYLDYLRRTAASLYEQDRFAEAVDVYKAIDSLQKLSPVESYLYANALQEEGRTFEAEKVLLPLRRGDKDDVYTHLATLYSPSRLVPPSERRQAAQELWRLRKEEWTVQVVYPALSSYGSNHDASEFIQNGLAQTSLHPRTVLFFQGLVLANKSDWKSARVSWEKALQIDGPYPTNDILRLQIYQTLVHLNQIGDMELFLKSALDNPSIREAYWALLLAQYYKETGRIDLMMGALEVAFTKDMESDNLLWAMRIAGIQYPAFGDKIVEQATKKPHGWKAILARDWVQLAGKDPAAFLASIQESKKYCDDEFAVLFECLRVLDSIFDDALAMGKLPPDQYSQFMVAYSAILAADVNQFGYQPYVWMLFNKFVVNAEKLEQAQALYNLYLGPRLDDGTLDPLLRAPYLFIVLQVADVKRIEQLWKLGGMPSADQIDAQWLVSMFYATKGDMEKANALLPTLAPSATFGPAAEAFRAYLQVKSGAKPELKKLAQKMSDSPSAIHWLALALVEQGDWDAALPLLEENVMLRQQGFFFLQARATEAYFNRLLALGQSEKANELAYNVSLSGYGNPIYAKIHYGPHAKIEAFQGTIELETVEFEHLHQLEPGSLRLTIDAGGNVSGSLAKKEEGRPVVGKVDAFGNLRATFKDGDREWSITGKIAPPPLYKALSHLKEGVQAFLLLDPKGQARFLIARQQLAKKPTAD